MMVMTMMVMTMMVMTMMATIVCRINVWMREPFCLIQVNTDSCAKSVNTEEEDDEMSVVEIMQPTPRKRGRPKGSKNKPKSKNPTKGVVGKRMKDDGSDTKVTQPTHTKRGRPKGSKNKKRKPINEDDELVAKPRKKKLQYLPQEPPQEHVQTADWSTCKNNDSSNLQDVIRMFSEELFHLRCS